MSKVVLWLLCLLPTFSPTVTKSWHSGTMCYVLQHSSTLVLFTMHYAHTVFMLCKVRIYCATYTYIVHYALCTPALCTHCIWCATYAYVAHYALCTVHFSNMHTLHMLDNLRINCALCTEHSTMHTLHLVCKVRMYYALATMHCALQHYAHIAYCAWYAPA